ncbi:MAG: uncharacterized protein QOC65_438 [Sphingomonadales bacterium]|nr:uncharacterized protein [Sphingomonadales bacterium]
MWLRRAYPVIAAIILFVGVPIFVLGAGFAGGFGSALSGFRMGLASLNPVSWLFMLPIILLPAYWWLGRRRNPPERAGLPARLVIGAACLFDAALLFGSVTDTPVAELASACHRGAYRLDDARLMAVSVSPVAALDVRLSDGTRAMTWTGDDLTFTGTSCIGASQPPDDFTLAAPRCPTPVVRVDTHDAPPQTATRIRLIERNADFRSGETEFRARLFAPAGEAPVPVVVLPAHRRGISTLDWGHEQYFIAALGIAVFVYDMPEAWPFGHGQIDSDRVATTHAAAALRRARELIGNRASRIGFYGGRDALLAVGRTGADFAVADLTALDEQSLRNTVKPMLLLVPGGDRDVPTARLVEVVQRLQTQGRPVQLVVFPDADRHMLRYERRGAERCQTGGPRSYYSVIADWLTAGEVTGEADAVVYRPPAGAPWRSARRSPDEVRTPRPEAP